MPVKSEAAGARSLSRVGGIRETAMDEQMRRKILKVLEDNRIMSIATLRADGWPQVTTVGFSE